MRRFAVVVLLVVFALIGGTMVVPAAAGPPELPEDRIMLLCGVLDFPPCITEFPAEAPFWIGHGVLMDHGKGVNQKGQAPAAGHFDFKLFIGEEEVTEDWTFHGGTVTFDVFVFPAGLSGETTFTGEWYATCTIEDVREGVEGCEKPSDPYLILANTVTIDFVSP